MWYFLFSIQTSLMQTYFTKILGWKTAFSYLFFVFQSLRVFAFLFSKIVLVAVQDSAASHVGVALDSLRRVGAIDPILVEFRGSYALIGTPDANKPPWVTQDQHPRYKGPSEISIRIPLSGKKKRKKKLFPRNIWFQIRPSFCCCRVFATDECMVKLKIIEFPGQLSLIAFKHFRLSEGTWDGKLWNTQRKSASIFGMGLQPCRHSRTTPLQTTSRQTRSIVKDDLKKSSLQ